MFTKNIRTTSKHVFLVLFLLNFDPFCQKFYGTPRDFAVRLPPSSKIKASLRPTIQYGYKLENRSF